MALSSGGATKIGHMHPTNRSSGIRGFLPSGRALIIIAILALLLAARSIASLVIEYQWWKELGQLPTWESMILYSFAPIVIAALVAFAVLWVAHARGLKHAGTGLREYPLYAKISTAMLLLLGLIIARSSLDPWTIVSYLGSARAGAGASTWTDPIFGRGLPFYFFELPLYSQLLGFLVGLTFFAAVVFSLPGRLLHVGRRMNDLRGLLIR
jgi:uncharacterized protein